ncbi:hypothetical protein [Streptomyces neyagawaensis]|uniref:hypothetical protein n=1 Tax=Streptomyces neyagawaensis TaxID=42238 RepID=UPI0006E2C20B|nr:hypothetical protein [Streptomyces neyagawaensis]MCL6737487.1 hypothetical protein [Streptomyces neyagawaensis]MDE1688229.1 hypothetical protein [Streptomyces neyagawaensis]
MIDNPPDVHLTIYSPGRFPAHLPFAEHGYLFTVPGSYPDDTPAHTNVTDKEMAVSRTNDDGDEWEARDTNDERRVWGTGKSRREAIGLAFLEIARRHRIDAAAIAEKRKLAGLEPVPPYSVEITSSVTLVRARFVPWARTRPTPPCAGRSDLRCGQVRTASHRCVASNADRQ